MTITQTRAQRPPAAGDLHNAVLPSWAVPATAAVTVGLTALITALTPVQGWAGSVLVALVLFLVLQTVASFSVEGRRHAVNRLATTLVVGCFLLAVVPLASLLATVVGHGAGAINATFLTHSLRNIGPRDPGGGVYHAIVGTLEQAGMASLISIPVAVLVAIYLVEYGRGALARWVTFFVDVMTGIPSIVAGLFLYTLWILLFGFQRSGFAAALALPILMIPIVVRSTEEMLKLVPNELREAAFALGVPRWRTILKVVVPTALPGIVTGIMLGIARIIGETAPLILLLQTTNSINFDLFNGPQSSLPLFIYEQAFLPNQSSIDRAWGAALTLIVIVMILSLSARVIARFSRVR